VTPSAMQHAALTKGKAAVAGPASSRVGVNAAAPRGAALRLQAALGNQAAARLLRAQGARARTEASELRDAEARAAAPRSSGPPHSVQARLEVSEPGDALEIEAERVADEVMRMPEPGGAVPPPTGRSGERVDRAGAACTAESELQRTESGTAGEAVAPPIVHDELGAPGRPLDAAPRAFMEPRFGHDFGNVRIHDDARAAASARAVNALAYTHGSDIVFDAGRYAPDTAAGQHLLAHELAHTIQHGASPALVSPTPEQQPTPPAKTAPAAPTTPAIRHVKVWWNSFIPMATINGPPGSDCFTGDSRGFSNAIHASSRTHQEIEVDVASLALTIDWKHIGTTHEVDCTTGAVKGSATAPTSEVTNGPVTRDGTDILIRFATAATNPLVTLAPAIDSIVTFRIDPVARTCSLSGQHDGFPGYEAYVTADGGAGVRVHGYDPRVTGKDVSALFPPMDETIPSTRVSF
jgi:hypothetical protein